MKQNPSPNTKHEPHEPMLTIRQAAEIFNVSIKTVWRRIDDGKLPVVRDGRVVRVRQSDLRAYIAVRRCEGP